jgi:2-polyprenyl-3-methyl-5-hydroxy-6-metoxy-1,4-benzoquinol methylase
VENDKHFSFGKNWTNFSKKIDQGTISRAEKDLLYLTGDLRDKSFLDIGSGSGLHSLAAINLGINQLVAVDIDEDSVNSTKNLLANLNFKNIDIYTDDILNTKIKEKFDIVYSWGVLHHTGNMYKAIENSLNLVKDDGLLIISIYLKTNYCEMWKKIKKKYTYGNKLTKTIMASIWLPLHLLRKITNKSIFKQKSRGMLWFYDSIDWLGGYPYESASKEEIEKFLINKKFYLLKSYKTNPSIGLFGSGCAEYVFKKK